VQALAVDELLESCVGRPRADADLEPLRPPAAGSGVLRQRVARSQETSVDHGATRVHDLGRCAVPAGILGGLIEDAELAKRREVAPGSRKRLGIEGHDPESSEAFCWLP